MKILFIVETDFWNKTKGISTRFNSIFDYFKNYDRHILYIGKVNKKQVRYIKENYTNNFYLMKPIKRKFYAIIRIILNKLHIKIPKFMYNPINQSIISKNKVRKIINKNKIEITWLYYLWNYRLLDKVNNTYNIIDCGDVQSEIVLNKKKNNIFFPSKLTLNEEFNILNKFNMVLAVSKRDYEIFNSNIENYKLYYLPFYFDTYNCYKESNDIKVGFIGGSADFNIIAAKRIIENIIPNCKSNFKMYFFGKVCDYIKEFSNNKNIILYGLVDNVLEAYNLMDVAINPTNMGSGLKTKCVEAMSYGIPLITTTIGAQGLEDGINDVFLLSDDDKVLAKDIDLLVNDSNMRKTLSKKGIDYININFGIDKYNNLEKLIRKSVNKNEKY